MKGLHMLGPLLLVATVAVAVEPPERVPSVEAVSLVAAFEGTNLQKIDAADWWMDTKKRQWTITRPVGPGVLDSRYQVVVSYSVEDQVRKSWAVDLLSKKVEPLK